MDTILIIAAALVLLLTWSIARIHRRQKARREAFQDVFDNAYARVEDKLSLDMGYGYGVPIFKITHSSREAHERSELSVANADFGRGIQAVCGKSGSRVNPYQATRAIHFAWLAVGNEVFFPPATPPDGTR